MEYKTSDLERYRHRRQSQRHYQRKHRDMQAGEGIPERDDVAKVVLAVMLDRCAREPDSIESFIKVIAGRLTLEKKRFDKDRSAEVVRKMIERHKEGREREARRRRAAERERQT